MRTFLRASKCKFQKYFIITIIFFIFKLKYLEKGVSVLDVERNEVKKKTLYSIF